MSASIRSLLAQNGGRVRLLEAHDRNSMEVIRRVVNNDGQSFQGVWISGLTQTTYLGFPDTELVSPLERASSMIGFDDQLQRDNCRPLCAAFDADSGGNVADIPALVTLLANMGVSMIVVEDKSICAPGEKVNSLKDTSSLQRQANMYEFARIIQAFRSASAHKEMMITARIESFIVRVVKEDEAEEKASILNALHDALTRAEVYRSAGSDAIMIHSKSASPYEVSSFLTKYRSKDPFTPLVVAPTTYSKCTEDTLYDAGANVIIYANHLMRAKIHAFAEFSDRFLASRPGFFSQDAELNACLEARNFGCLAQKLFARKDLSAEAEQYRDVADRQATENMTAVVECLLDGKVSSAADTRILAVEELLKINAHQISVGGNLSVSW